MLSHKSFINMHHDQMIYINLKISEKIFLR